MEFTPADAWQEFKTASRTEQGTLDDNGNEVVLGPRLNEAVRHLANGYLKTLELGPENKATDERAKLLDLHWGRIELDGAQLQGLGAAITNLATTLAENVTKLGERWQGESYTAFTTAMAKMQRTLSEYGDAATTTGDGMVNAMAQVRTMYQTFAEDSVNNHLNFGDVSPPEKWHKIVDWADQYSGKELAACCPSDHLGGFDYNSDCIKNNDEQRNMITGHFVSESRWEICKQDGCEESLDRVSIMYTNLTEQCDAAIERIKGKLHNYFGAVNTTVDGVTKLYDAAVGNVFTLGHAEVFSSLRVIGAGGGGAPSGGDTGYPGGGDTSYPGPGGGGGTDAGPVGVAEPMQPTPEPAPEPAVADTAPAAALAQEPPADESVQIKDGDRTISVTSPDGEGHVRVSVDDGTGKTKSYELDFDAANGLAREPAAQDAAVAPDGEAPEQIPARTDGKCVIQDGPLTITAERPLFSPDSLNITVDDGTGTPTKYTVDFDDVGTDTAGTDTAADGTATPGGTPPRGTDSQSGHEATPGGTPPETTEDAATPEAVAGPASGDAADGAAVPARDGAALAPDGSAGPDRDGSDLAADGATGLPGDGVDPAAGDAAAASGGAAVSARDGAAQAPDGAGQAADGAAGLPGDGADPAAGGAAAAPGGAAIPARDGAAQAADGAAGQPGVGATPDAGDSASAPASDGAAQAPDAAAPAGEGGTAPGEQPVAAGSTSAASAEQRPWVGGQAGSVSGVLVPDQAGPGQAVPYQAAPDQGSAGSATGHAAMPDGQQTEASGVAGAGLPMMGTPGGSGGATEAGRAGSGWSVHGDLFDSGEPVYSMHGVLGDEERTAE